MNKYLVSSTVLAFCVTGTANSALAETNLEGVSNSGQYCEQVYNFASLTERLYDGDFQNFARSAENKGLYSGTNSVTMGTIRLMRH